MARKYEQRPPEDPADVSILKYIWRFTNESEILSAVIISLVAVLGVQLTKIYTYIYWMPYFTRFDISPEYFEIALFDSYSSYIERLPALLGFTIALLGVNWIIKKYRWIKRYGLLKFTVFSGVVAVLCMILSTAFARKSALPAWLAVIPFEIRSKIWLYIAIALMMVVEKNLLKYIFVQKPYRRKFSPTITWCVFLVVLTLLVTGIVVYIQGYNDNSISFSSGPLEIIDDDKLILFETADQYYVILCTENEDKSLTIDTTYYAFLDKDEQWVHYEYYSTIYDHYGRIICIGG